MFALSHFLNLITFYFSSYKEPNTPVETVPPPGTVAAHDSSKDDRTVFISNLDYTVTEEDVKKILSEVGTVEEFRLVRDFKGRSKGYGYMVFSNKVGTLCE